MIFFKEHTPSIFGKLCMSLGVLLGLCFGTIIVIEEAAGNSYRLWLMFICCLIYFIRFTITLFVFIQRKISKIETATVSVLFFMMFYYFSSSAGRYPEPLGILDIFSVLLFMFGSWLNVSADYQRFVWKRRPENAGKLYTTGLFKHAMHINYFGDNLSYLGLALIAHNLGCIGVSIGFVFYFIGFEIPRLDNHLHQKYKNDFANYSKVTKKFIPFVY